MVFEGEELLPFAIPHIRSKVDFISATIQPISYFGNKASPETLQNLQKYKENGLIDELLYFEPNNSIHPKENELALRNLGLNASRKAGCTHHISADTDEFYKEDQLEYAKSCTEKCDCSIVELVDYYKHPTYKITPHRKQMSTLIHSVDNEYVMDRNFPYKIEITRRIKNYSSCKVFTLEEFAIHHMSYIRKDLRKKLENSCTGTFYDINKFISDFDKYKLGDKFVIAPENLVKRTEFSENIFNINL